METSNIYVSILHSYSIHVYTYIVFGIEDALSVIFTVSGKVFVKLTFAFDEMMQETAFSAARTTYY